MSFTFTNDENKNRLIIAQGDERIQLPTSTLTAYLDQWDNLILEVGDTMLFHQPISATDLSGATATDKMTSLLAMLY